MNLAAEKSANWYYSQMERTIAQELSGKGTADAMLHAIEAYAKGGKFKAEELDWSGVREWLQSKGTEKITKQEIAGALRGRERFR